jgi:chromosome segregation ATPase
MKSKIFQKEQEFEEQRRLFSTKVQEMENIFQDKKNELLLKIQQLESKEPEVREVVVEKETTDNSWKPKLEALQNTVQKLKQDNIDKDKKIKEYEKTIEDIQKFNNDKKALFLKGSNLDDKLYR